MATIDKISAILNTKIEIPFKIKARESIHTNPFKDSKFDGKILPADIFEGSELKSQNKAKMVLSAIAGSVSNFSKKFVEPVAAFCKNIKEKTLSKCSSAWNYLNTTTLSDLGHSITDLGHSITEKVSTMRKNAEMKKISDTTPTTELEALWKKENELILMEAA